MAKFRVTVFDPVMLLAQMTAMQCAYYLVAGVIIGLLSWLLHLPPSLGLLFDAHQLRSDTSAGWLAGAALILSGAAGYGATRRLRLLLLPPPPPRDAGRTPLTTRHILLLAAVTRRALALVVLVGRAKQCLDFAATVHAVHLVVCIAYGGWPGSFYWWAVAVTSLIVMAVLGEYLCMKRELAPIALAGQDLSRPNGGGGGGGGGGPRTDDIEMQDLRPGRAVRDQP